MKTEISGTEQSPILTVTLTEALPALTECEMDVLHQSIVVGDNVDALLAFARIFADAEDLPYPVVHEYTLRDVEEYKSEFSEGA